MQEKFSLDNLKAVALFLIFIHQWPLYIRRPNEGMATEEFPFHRQSLKCHFSIIVKQTFNIYILIKMKISINLEILNNSHENIRKLFFPS